MAEVGTLALTVSSHRTANMCPGVRTSIHNTSKQLRSYRRGNSKIPGRPWRRRRGKTTREKVTRELWTERRGRISTFPSARPIQPSSIKHRATELSPHKRPRCSTSLYGANVSLLIMCYKQNWPNSIWVSSSIYAWLLIRYFCIREQPKASGKYHRVRWDHPATPGSFILHSRPSRVWLRQLALAQVTEWSKSKRFGSSW